MKRFPRRGLKVPSIHLALLFFRQYRKLKPNPGPADRKLWEQAKSEAIKEIWANEALLILKETFAAARRANVDFESKVDKSGFSWRDLDWSGEKEGVK